MNGLILQTKLCLDDNEVHELYHSLGNLQKCVIQDNVFSEDFVVQCIIRVFAGHNGIVL